jgi:hypothetical protein
VVSASGTPVRGLKGRRWRTASLRPSRNPSASGRALNDLQCSRPSTAHRTRNRAVQPLPSFLMSQPWVRAAARARGNEDLECAGGHQVNFFVMPADPPDIEAAIRATGDVCFLGDRSLTARPVEPDMIAP